MKRLASVAVGGAGAYLAYRWFALGNALPGLSMSAETAARKILRAVALGDAEAVLGVPAKLARAVAPNLVSALAAAADRFLLPEAGGVGPAPGEGRRQPRPDAGRADGPPRPRRRAHPRDGRRRAAHFARILTEYTMEPETPDRDDDVSSPYGPQTRTDDAAGGADSSPYETTPAAERPQAAKADPATGTETGDRKATG